MLFIFLCICSLFPLFFDGTNDGLAYLFMKSGNPGHDRNSRLSLFGKNSGLPGLVDHAKSRYIGETREDIA